jgi:hypothetical protein
MIMSIKASFWDVDASGMRIWGTHRIWLSVAVVFYNYVLQKYYIEHENETEFDLTTAGGVETITECIYRKDSC